MMNDHPTPCPKDQDSEPNDDALWQKALEDLVPCPKTNAGSADTTAIPDFHLPAYHPDAFSALPTAQTVTYRKSGVSLRQFHRQFAYPFQAQYILDLHHMRAASAYDACQYALAHCRRQGFRRLRLICGKGRHGTSVMKGMVLYVLDRTDWVLAYRSADVRQGGTGAVDVYLQSPQKNNDPS